MTNIFLLKKREARYICGDDVLYILSWALNSGPEHRLVMYSDHGF